VQHSAKGIRETSKEVKAAGAIVVEHCMALALKTSGQDMDKSKKVLRPLLAELGFGLQAQDVQAALLVASRGLLQE
jgi:hypothetical protein